jgi:hypothetical protein
MGKCKGLLWEAKVERDLCGQSVLQALPTVAVTPGVNALPRNLVQQAASTERVPELFMLATMAGAFARYVAIVGSSGPSPLLGSEARARGCTGKR